jgi:hypothetical protein
MMIDDDDFNIWLDRKSFDAFLNREIWKMSCIFIESDRFNWQLAFSIFFIRYELIIFEFNFFDERTILIFFVDSHIKSSSL